MAHCVSFQNELEFTHVDSQVDEIPKLWDEETSWAGYHERMQKQKEAFEAEVKRSRQTWTEERFKAVEEGFGTQVKRSRQAEEEFKI